MATKKTANQKVLDREKVTGEVSQPIHEKAVTAQKPPPELPISVPAQTPAETPTVVPEQTQETSQPASQVTTEDSSSTESSGQ